MTGKRTPLHSTLSAACLCVAVALALANGYGLTEDDRYTLWGDAARRFEAQHRFLAADAEDSRWVEKVGRAIVESWPDRRWVGHQFLVVEDSRLAAWSFPLSPVRHNVYVTTGLLRALREHGAAHRDDRLAGVLGHEIAHLMRDHHLLRDRRRVMLGEGVPEDLADWPVVVLNRWQEEDEFEADRYGAFYALHAGYRFDGIVEFLALYMRKRGGGQFEDMVDKEGVHPGLIRRIAALKSEETRIEEAQQLFQSGLDLVRAGAWEAARACFAKVANTFWLSPTVMHNLAYTELKQYEAVLSAGPALDQCVSTSYAAELRLKGPQGSAEGALLAEAKLHFLQACELDKAGGFLAARHGLACVYLYEGHDAEARNCLQRQQVGRDDSEYLNLVGALTERSGDLAGARREYCKALNLSANTEAREVAAGIESNPRPYLPALYNLGRLLEAQGHQPEAAQLYASYLSIEGQRSAFGVRARDGLLRCGGHMPGRGEPQVVDSYRGVDLRSSGPLVVKAALGEPEGQHSLPVDRGRIAIYRYPSQGIQVTFARASARGDSEAAVVYCVTLSAPNQESVAGVKVGDSEASLQERLGPPRAVTPGPADTTWWDYSPFGLTFAVANGQVQQCVIGGRR